METIKESLRLGPQRYFKYDSISKYIRKKNKPM